MLFLTGADDFDFNERNFSLNSDRPPGRACDADWIYGICNHTHAQAKIFGGDFITYDVSGWPIGTQAGILYGLLNGINPKINSVAALGKSRRKS